MGRFTELASVRTKSGGIYFPEGSFLVDVLGVKFVQGRKGESFVVEAQVLESSNAALSAGARASHVITIKPEYLETCLGDIKHVVSALLEIDDPDGYNEPITADDNANAYRMGRTPQELANERFWEQAVEYLCGPEQPARGIKIRLTCTKILTRNNREFTRHIWGPVVHDATPDVQPITEDDVTS